MTETCDVAVVGGGPAGSTLATLLAKHAPGKRVVLLEKARFPRHHVGESLLPEIVPVLRELGALEKIDAAGFPRKLGATYVWGRTRRPWDADFGALKALLERRGAVEQPGYAWQVQRSRYDQILLDHARSRGVDVREGWAAQGILEDVSGRVAGLKALDEKGRPRELRAEWTADCGGQNGFLSRWRSVRRYNARLKNIAFYAYFRGAKWKYVYSGHPDKTRIFICSVGSGWLWYIPVSADVVSVGLVCSQEHFQDQKLEPEAFYAKALRSCKEVWPLLRKAERVADVDGTGKGFFTLSDWSYLCDRAAGEGWIAAGDAALFVDPILSSGVTLAHLSGHRAAYTLATWWESQAEVRRRLIEDYSQFYREAAASFLVLALYWYGGDKRAQGWWEQAAAAAALPLLEDKDAFVMVSAGLASGYEKLQTIRGLLLEGTAGNPAFLKNVLGVSAPQGGAAGIDGAVVKLLHPFEIVASFAAEPDSGRLRPVDRVRFLKRPAKDPLAEALNPKRYAFRPQLEVLRAIDGRRSVAEIRAATADALGMSDQAAGLVVSRFLEELLLYGVADVKARKGARR